MHTDSYLLCTEGLRKKVQIDFHFHRKSSDMDDGMTGFYMKSSGHHVNNGGSTGGGNNCNSGAKCGRWNPTTEQVKVLTDLFRSGLRTPSTDQIQKISSQLSFYGKIESKNVFYWFQNHKARERQKRRKVSVDEKDVLRRLDKFSSKKHYLEFNHVSADEPERVVETLQLFPLNSFEEEEEEPQKLRLHANECRESKTTFSYKIGTDIDPPLDLRLSFL